MKRILALCAIFSAALCVAQTTPAPIAVAVTGQAIGVRIGGQTHGGADATEALSFINSKALGAFALESHQITTTDNALTAYLGGVKWTPKLDDLLAKTTLPPQTFQVAFHADPGVVWNIGGKGHLGGIVGGELDYDPSSSSHFSMTLIRVDYLRAQGVGIASNGYAISGGITLSRFGGAK